MIRIDGGFRRMIGAATYMIGQFAGIAGCVGYQQASNGMSVAASPSPDQLPSVVSAQVDSTARGARITVVDLTKKFLVFFDSASKTPLDRGARWAMWQRLYGFAARPPGPFG